MPVNKFSFEHQIKSVTPLFEVITMIVIYRTSTRRETPKPQVLWMWQGLLVFIRSANPPLQTSGLQGTSELLHYQIIVEILLHH